MIGALILAASISAAPPPRIDTGPLLAGAGHAIRADRLDQASLMVSRAMAAGASGPALDRVLADLDFARGRFAEALSRYDGLLKASPSAQSLLEPAALSALRLGQLDRAIGLLNRATVTKGGSWRVWNACGIAADLKSEWARADECYDEATKLAPDQPGIANNRGWSRLLRGDWQGAAGFFEQAVALDPKSQRTANNLELARSALAADLPQRQTGESDNSWAARLNDAGMAAAILGNKDRAAAAFNEALSVSGTWYARAANNLEAIGRR